MTSEAFQQSLESTDECLRALGLQHGASWDEINQAYRDLIRIWHPDRFQGDPRLRARSEEQTRLLNHAITFLRREYKPGPRKAQTKIKAPPATAKRSARATNKRAPGPTQKKSQFQISPLMAYHKKIPCVSRIASGALLGVFGVGLIYYFGEQQLRSSIGAVLMLLAAQIIVRHSCLLAVRRPLIRVDATGLRSFETGLLAWSDFARVWTMVQSNSAAVGVECTNLYVSRQPIFRRLLLKIRHLINKAHIVVQCSGLDHSAVQVVRALEAQHVTGDIQPAQIDRPHEVIGVPWCRVIATASAASIIIRTAFGFSITSTEMIVYLAVFIACQAYDTMTRLMQVPLRA